LVQHRTIHDLETGGGFTLKRYRSTKAQEKSGSWHHTEVILEPLNQEFDPIILTDVREEEIRVIAEWVDSVAAMEI
jgi:hypothetical protein